MNPMLALSTLSECHFIFYVVATMKKCELVSLYAKKVHFLIVAVTQKV
jgi:hypothetical protein